MADIPTITDVDIRQWVGADGLASGRTYYQGGSLDRLRREGRTLKGRCAGYSAPYYLVEATFGEDGSVSHASCTCPVGEGGHCKHVGALLVAYRAEPAGFAQVTEVLAGLAERSKEELLSLIRLLLEHAPELCHLLEIRLPSSGTAGVKVDPQPYRRQVRRVFDAIDPHDWQAPERAGPELQPIIQFARDFLEGKDPVNAARVGIAFVEEVIIGYETLEDEGCTFPDLIGEGARLLVECLPGLTADPRERKQLLVSLLELFWFLAACGTDEDVDLLRTALGTQTMPEERAELARSVRTKMSEEEVDDWLEEALEELLFDLEADTLDEESYLGQLRERGRSVDLTRELLKRDRLPEARELAETLPDEALPALAALFDSAGHPGELEPRIREREQRSHCPGFLRWLVDRFAESEPARALDVAERLYRLSSPNMSYAAVRELALRCGRWGELYPQFIEWIESQKQWPQLSEAFILEGEIDRALSLLTDPRSMYLDPVRIARAAEESRPMAAAEIYQKRIQDFINARGRGNYAAATGLLLRVRDLYRRVENPAGWERYLAGLRERNKGLPALKDELANAGL